ncbi:hypothetical protein L218DRAFT_950997 [Marasmius fiardii PR-910]|nr:hypothetical protein L218DRAFT_950997 [Marasmius fiardii PR-910]
MYDYRMKPNRHLSSQQEVTAKAAFCYIAHAEASVPILGKVPQNLHQTAQTAILVWIQQILSQTPEDVQIQLRLGSEAIGNPTQNISDLSGDDIGRLNRATDAKNSLTEAEEIPMDLEVQPSLRPTGAKLAEMTQSSAYQHIRSLKSKKYEPQRRTVANLANIQRAYYPNSGSNQTKKRYGKEFGPKISPGRAGTNWQRANYRSDMQERAICQKCNKLEDMEHILTECKYRGQEIAWNLAEKAWKKTEFKWQKPDLGLGSRHPEHEA